ncbi:MAG: response regulator [Campylobacterota bacterium]|nr:response regulator [Campylobacterota bacterium]
MAQNPQNTMDILNEYNIDIIFLDISAKQFDGIKLLKHIKKQPIRQSKIVGVTVLDDHTYRFEALKLKVFRYIYKPYDNKEIQTLLEKFFNKNYYNKEINRTNNFINIEDIDKTTEKSIDYEDKTTHEKELLDNYNNLHQKTSAKDFLDSYDEWGVDIEDLNDLEMALDRLMMSIMMDNDFKGALPDILSILETYNKFLFIFTEFDELSKVVYSIVILLREINFEKIPSETMVSKLVLTTIQDLVEWKERVFIAQDCKDVYYINDPILNSYVQLQDLLS